jgi:hydrogenase nickel incorporation protein HypA/HybF
MHEMSLAERTLQTIEETADKEKYNKVLAVWLEIGQLSGVETQALVLCFDAITRGSVAEGAR